MTVAPLLELVNLELAPADLRCGEGPQACAAAQGDLAGSFVQPAQCRRQMRSLLWRSLGGIRTACTFRSSEIMILPRHGEVWQDRDGRAGAAGALSPVPYCMERSGWISMQALRHGLHS